MKNYTNFCLDCGWEGSINDLGTNTDLSDQNIGNTINFTPSCPTCHSENIKTS